MGAMDTSLGTTSYLGEEINYSRQLCERASMPGTSAPARDDCTREIRRAVDSEVALECTKLAGSVELIRIVESIPLVTKQGYT